MNQTVLVAGAGPVGMTMAIALKRLGVDVRIIDRSAARTDKSKALVIWPRTLELLDIQGFAQGFIDAGVRGKGARIMAEGRELAHVSFDVAQSLYRFALFLPQSETERLLEEELARLALGVERQVELVSFAAKEAGVQATLRHPDGREEVLRASWLIGCDGAHSTVRHGLGMGFEGSAQLSDWMLADVRIDGELDQQELNFSWQPSGVLALFPITGGRFRVIADIGPSSAQGAPPTVEEVQHILDTRGPKGLHAHDPAWLSRFHINERKVARYRQGRVFLAGDAAHIHSPAGGQGMNTGMQDAFNLAWKLAMVWHARTPENLLDSYSGERSAIGDQVLRKASNLTRVSTLHNPILRELRNAAAGVLSHVPALRQRFVDQLAELDLHYSSSPLTSQGRGEGTTPASGYRAQDVALQAGESGATRLHETLRSGRFAVLSVGVPALRLAADLAPLAVAAHAAQDAAYTPDHHYLIRPDGYVAASAGADAGDSTVAWLRHILSV